MGVKGKIIYLVLILWGFPFLWNNAYGQKNQPNVLMIAIDDLNDWVGYLEGHPQVKTPNIDRLAESGVAFTNAYCQAPLCNPSRTSLMTGLRPSTTGIYALGPWFRSLDEYKSLVTLPQYFQQNGYETMTTGKVYHDAYPPKEARADGVEFSKWGFHGGFFPRPEQPFVPESGHPLVDWGVFPEQDIQQDDWKVADWAIEQLKNTSGDQPFFLSVGFRHPHVPLYATKQWFDLYPEDELKLPDVRSDDRDDIPPFAWYLHWDLPEPRLAWLKMHHEWEAKVRAYLASVSFTDMLVGRLLQTLNDEGLMEHTIVVLFSDHGYHLGSKAITGKNTLWHESTRVPLVIAGPGVNDKGQCDEAVELLDIYPTLVELAGLPQKKGLEGLSLKPQLDDVNKQRKRPAICTHGPNNHVVVTEKWRFIRYADLSRELYDRKNDPNEWKNLASDQRYTSTMEDLAAFLPEKSADPAPYNKVRLIEMINGKPYWEGTAIEPGDPVPMEFK